MGGNPNFLFGLRGRSRISTSFLLVFLLFLGGCHRIGLFSSGSGGPEEEGPVAGSGTVYQGFLIIDGGNLPAALEIFREGRRTVRGILQTSEGVMAQGEGRIRGGTLTLELTYGGGCPGRLNLEGEWDQDELLYEGEVAVSDCTGTTGGTFQFAAS